MNALELLKFADADIEGGVVAYVHVEKLQSVLSATPQPEGEYENLHKTIALLTKQLIKVEGATPPPEGRVAIPRDVAEAKGMYLVGYSWLKHNAPDELTTPLPEGDGWIKLPGDAEKQRCLVYTPSDIPDLEYRIAPQEFVRNMSDATHYMPLHPPTGLKRQQPPQEGEGDA